MDLNKKSFPKQNTLKNFKVDAQGFRKTMKENPLTSKKRKKSLDPPKKFQKVFEMEGFYHKFFLIPWAPGIFFKIYFDGLCYLG